MKSAVIFGANGQDGYYLNKVLAARGVSVTGVSRQGDWTHLDVADFTSVCEIIKSTRPHYIFHLAANSTTRHEALFENHSTISTGTLNILEAVKLYSRATKVFLSGSGLQFINTGNPIKETDPFEATSAYAVSRIQSVYAARYYRSSLGIRAYVGYLFNHDSPLRPNRHMSRKIAEFATRVARGGDEIMEIGDITVRKEWGFAGDIVEGILSLISQERIFEATIGTGIAYSIEDWLNECFRISGGDWRTHIRKNENFTAEYRTLYADTTTIQSLGWQPRVSFSDLAKMMMSGT